MCRSLATTDSAGSRDKTANGRTSAAGSGSGMAGSLCRPTVARGRRRLRGGLVGHACGSKRHPQRSDLAGGSMREMAVSRRRDGVAM